MLVRDFFGRVSRLLTDIAPQFRRWSEVELVQAANDGQTALAKYLPSAGGRIDAIKLQPGSRQFIGTIPAARILPGDGSTAADVRVIQLQDIVCNMGADGATPGAAVSVVSREMLDAHSPGWRTAAGAAVIEHYTFDPRTPGYFYVYPPVRASGGDVWVEAMLLACPPAIPLPEEAGAYGISGASTAVLGIPDTHADDLLNYVLARAWMKDAETAGSPQLAQLHANLFVQSVNAQATVQTGTNPGLKVLPLSPNILAAAS